MGAFSGSRAPPRRRRGGRTATPGRTSAQDLSSTAGAARAVVAGLALTASPPRKLSPVALGGLRDTARLARIPLEHAWASGGARAGARRRGRRPREPQEEISGLCRREQHRVGVSTRPQDGMPHGAAHLEARLNLPVGRGHFPLRAVAGVGARRPSHPRRSRRRGQRAAEPIHTSAHASRPCEPLRHPATRSRLHVLRDHASSNRHGHQAPRVSPCHPRPAPASRPTSQLRVVPAPARLPRPAGAGGVRTSPAPRVNRRPASHALSVKAPPRRAARAMSPEGPGRRCEAELAASLVHAASDASGRAARSRTPPGLPRRRGSVPSASRPGRPAPPAGRRR